MATSFGEFYQRLGFREYPFSVFTSENEQGKSKDLFIDTSMYSPIIEGFDNGSTMLLAGDRGTGKTAIIYDFCRKADKDHLIVSLTDFSELQISYQINDLYKFLISQFSERLFSALTEERRKGHGLLPQDRLLASYLVKHFVKLTTRNDLQRKLRALQTGVIGWIGRFAYQVLRIPLNLGANAAVGFLSDLISQAAGTPKHSERWAEYFPELTGDVDMSFNDPEFSFSMLKKSVALARKFGYKRVSFVFDKIDEDARLNNAAEEIASFIEPLVTDNRLLLNGEFQVVISLWVIPFTMLKDRVRTQKIFCPSVSWSSEDLIRVC